MRRQELLAYKTAYDFFSPHLSDKDFEQLSICRFPAGKLLMKEANCDDNAAYYLLEGVGEGVCSTVQDQENDGLYYVPTKLEKDSFVGFSEAIEKTLMERTISIRAKSDVTALKIPKKVIHRWGREKTEFLMVIFKKILSHSWRQRAVVSSSNSHSTDIRLALHLQYLYQIYANSCYPPGYAGSVRLLDTHQEIACAIGCSGRTVDRAITSFSKQGRITVKRGKIHLDRAQYQALWEYIEKNA